MRKKQGAWGIFGIRREKLKDIQRKQTLETLKQRKAEEGIARRDASLEEKRRQQEFKWQQKSRVMKAKADYYEQQARKKKAKRAVTREWPALPTTGVKIKKRKQGKKLSSKSRIRLI